MEGAFSLYRAGEEEIEATFKVIQKGNGDQEAAIRVRADSLNERDATFRVVYADQEELEATFEVVGSSYLDASIEVNPNGIMNGIFELLPPPRVNKQLSSVADSFTRSRSDLRTLNYGFLQRMMIGSTITDLGYDYNESFVRFNNFENEFFNLAILEKANLRLYYAGELPEGSSIELYTADKKWNENGITDANKPLPDGFVSDYYTINRDEKYIEFNVMELLQQWIDKRRENFGFLIKSSNDYGIQFYTKESNKPPVIDVQYVSNEVYSVGRTDAEATMFIMGVGDSDAQATFEVHSNYRTDDIEAGFYVHRYEVPILEEEEFAYAITKENQVATLAVSRRDVDEVDASLVVTRYGEGSDLEKEATLLVSKDSHDVTFIVEPDAFLPATLSVRSPEEVVTREMEFIASKPEQEATIGVRAIGEDDLELSIEVPNYDYIEGSFVVTKPDQEATLDVQNVGWLDVELYVSHRSEQEAEFMVVQHDNIEATFDVVHSDDTEAEYTVSKPEFEATLSARVADEDDEEIEMSIRQIDANDLEAVFRVGGQVGLGYYFII